MTRTLLRQSWISLNRWLVKIFLFIFMSNECSKLFSSYIQPYDYCDTYLIITAACCTSGYRLCSISSQHLVFLTFDCTLKIHVTVIYSKESLVKLQHLVLPDLLLVRLECDHTFSYISCLISLVTFSPNGISFIQIYFCYLFKLLLSYCLFQSFGN